ncbi:hypothetical protein N7533_008458 [Penicillium manginii]|uniref:uncharacterized protein n=1 Tax=Penicillium manginii TaxID=203109 RepID=UPI00254834CA|nr:uncharacterized protein N7533_008458 [Penicillium manginii]KAJ5743588.1 hypothetical protein N7533_008458 [Penicillium manginii]
MRFSPVAILCSMFAVSSLASPVESSTLSVATERCYILCDNSKPYGSRSIEKREAVETKYEALFKIATPCCINCDNPYARCGSSSSERREDVDRDHEALFGSVKWNDDVSSPQWPSKRCCILCDDPYARCGSNDKRELVSTLEEAVGGTN